MLLVCVCCAVEVTASPAQTFATLLSFNGTDGDEPGGTLVQGLDGNFYGTTSGGGANNWGTVFKITPTGTLTTLYNFCSQTNCTDGSSPEGLVVATNGNFYGTTLYGGANYSGSCSSYGCGTVFEITPGGTLTRLHSFDGADGYDPNGGLVQATNGDFYGTTHYGTQTSGTVFKITPGGTLTTLYRFCRQPSCTIDGEYPLAGLVLAASGNFYGTTYEGGTHGLGTVFEITADDKLTSLYSFCSQTLCADGAFPFAGLVQASNGNFYGTTSEDGASQYGAVFKITPGGTLTTLHSFDLSDGDDPRATLIQATNGNFFGTTLEGGANYGCSSTDGCGTAFEITPGGTLTTLYNFCAQTGCTDGDNPATLVQATNGSFYGTTLEGGDSSACSTYGCGTVFSLSVGLGPFVETLPTSGKVGAAVEIMGNNLTGSTSVTFNGTAAAFTVISSTEIKATVPSGATTGRVKVTTPSRTLTSNVNFRVR